MAIQDKELRQLIREAFTEALDGTIRLKSESTPVDSSGDSISTQLNANLSLNGSTGVSSMILCSLERDVSVADDYSDPIYLL